MLVHSWVAKQLGVGVVHVHGYPLELYYCVLCNKMTGLPSEYCIAASPAQRRMELGFFSEKVLRISADTEKTYIPHAHILC